MQPTFGIHGSADWREGLRPRRESADGREPPTGCFPTTRRRNGGSRNGAGERRAGPTAVRCAAVRRSCVPFHQGNRYLTGAGNAGAISAWRPVRYGHAPVEDRLAEVGDSGVSPGGVAERGVVDAAAQGSGYHAEIGVVHGAEVAGGVVGGRRPHEGTGGCRRGAFRGQAQDHVRREAGKVEGHGPRDGRQDLRRRGEGQGEASPIRTEVVADMDRPALQGSSAITWNRKRRSTPTRPGLTRVWMIMRTNPSTIRYPNSSTAWRE